MRQFTTRHRSFILYLIHPQKPAPLPTPKPSVVRGQNCRAFSELSSEESSEERCLALRESRVGKWRACLDGTAPYHRQRIVVDQLPRLVRSNDLCGGIASTTQDRRSPLRSMCIRRQKVHTLVAKEAFRTVLRGTPEFAGNAHCGDLDIDALRDKIRQDGASRL